MPGVEGETMPIKAASSQQRSFVRASNVSEHLKQIKEFHESTLKFDGDKIKLYEYFLDLEHKYVHGGFPVTNYCNVVMKLHPVKDHDFSERSQASSKNKTFDDRDDYNRVYSIKEMLVCPQCAEPIPIEESFKLHITKEVKSCLCQKCSGITTYESLLVKAFLKNSKTLLKILADKSGANVVDFKSLLLWFKDSLNFYIKYNTSELRATYKKGAFKEHFIQVRAKFADKVQYVRNNLSFLPLDLVQGLFVQLDFVNKICSNYEHWASANTIDIAIARYVRFLNLLKENPDTKLLVPTMDIDLAWHAHQVAPKSLYRIYCETNFGEIIDHDDTLGKSPLSIGYARTFILWNQTYNEYYSNKAPDYKDYFYRIKHKINPFRWYKWYKYGKIKSGRANAAVITTEDRNSGNPGKTVPVSNCAGFYTPIFVTHVDDHGNDHGNHCDSACATQCASCASGACGSPSNCGSSCGSSCGGGGGDGGGSSCGGGGDGGGSSCGGGGCGGGK